MVSSGAQCGRKRMRARACNHDCVRACVRAIARPPACVRLHSLFIPPLHWCNGIFIFFGFATFSSPPPRVRRHRVRQSSEAGLPGSLRLVGGVRPRSTPPRRRWTPGGPAPPLRPAQRQGAERVERGRTADPVLARVSVVMRVSVSDPVPARGGVSVACVWVLCVGLCRRGRGRVGRMRAHARQCLSESASVSL